MAAPPSYEHHMQTATRGQADEIGKPGLYGGLATGQSVPEAMVNFIMCRTSNSHPWGLNLVTEMVNGRTNWYCTAPTTNSIAEYTGLGVLCPPGCALLIWSVNNRDCGEWHSQQEWNRNVGASNTLELSLLPCTIDVVRRIIYWEHTHRSTGALEYRFQKHIDKARKVRRSTSQNPMNQYW